MWCQRSAHSTSRLIFILRKLRVEVVSSRLLKFQAFRQISAEFQQTNLRWTSNCCLVEYSVSLREVRLIFTYRTLPGFPSRPQKSGYEKYLEQSMLTSLIAVKKRLATMSNLRLLIYLLTPAQVCGESLNARRITRS